MPPYYAKAVPIRQMTPSPTIEIALADAKAALAGVSDSPRLDAEALLAFVLDAPRSRLFSHPETKLGDGAAATLAAAVARRKQGEPVAYITGKKEFWSLELVVTRDTLVPRPETETLVERALARIPGNRPCRVLELGTGSGAVACAIAAERPKTEIVATDASQAAIDVARGNAAQHHLNNIRFVTGDWIVPVIDERFDIVVSNPPYVRQEDPALEALRFEPRSALAAGPDGLDAIRTIADGARKIVADQGVLLLEHGADQRDSVHDILRRLGWTEIESFEDLSGHPRVTTARIDNSPIRGRA